MRWRALSLHALAVDDINTACDDSNSPAFNARIVSCAVYAACETRRRL